MFAAASMKAKLKVDLRVGKARPDMIVDVLRWSKEADSQQGFPPP